MPWQLSLSFIVPSDLKLIKMRGSPGASTSTEETVALAKQELARAIERNLGLGYQLHSEQLTTPKQQQKEVRHTAD